MLGGDIGKDGRSDEEARPRDLTFEHHPTFPLSDLKVLQNLLPRPFINHGPHAMARIFGWTDLHAQRGLLQPAQERLVNGFVDNRSRTGRAFLTLKAGERGHNARNRLVEIRCLIDDNGVLSTHFHDHAFDKSLFCGHAAGLGEDLQPHSSGSGE